MSPVAQRKVFSSSYTYKISSSDIQNACAIPHFLCRDYFLGIGDTFWEVCKNVSPGRTLTFEPHHMHRFVICRLTFFSSTYEKSSFPENVCRRSPRERFSHLHLHTEFPNLTYKMGGRNLIFIS